MTTDAATAEKTDAAKTPPAPHFEYKKGEETVKVLMSFGLIDMLARKIGDVERLFQIGADFELNDLIFRHVLTLDDKGRPHPDSYDAFIHAEGISFDHMQALLMWTAEHLTDFFIGSLGQTITTLEKQKGKFLAIQERGAALQSSFVGSKS